MSMKPISAPNGQHFAREAHRMTELLETISDLTRFSELGLADPPRDGSLPRNGTTADLLAYALMEPGSTDLIRGIVRRQRRDHEVLAHIHSTHARGLAVVDELLRRVDAEEDPSDYTPDEEMVAPKEPEKGGKTESVAAKGGEEPAPEGPPGR